MIISVHGTARGKRSSAPTLSLLASLTMLQRNKKTLILPLCGNTMDMDLEMLMDSATKMDRESASMEGVYEFNDNGVDAFFRQTSAGRLTAAHFDDYTLGLAKIKNYLDIAPATSQPDFEKMLEMTEEDIQMLFTAANEVYNYTFVLVNSSNDVLTSIIDRMADKIIVTIRQGRAEELPWTAGDDKELRQKTFFVVEDYEKESGFDVGVLKKGYKTKDLYTIPHNVQYRDAIAGGTILQYALKNANTETVDYNNELSENVRKLMDGVTGKAAEDEEEEPETMLEDKEKTSEPEKEKDQINADDVVERKVKKGGLFSKKFITKKVIKNSGEKFETEDTKKESINNFDLCGDIQDEAQAKTIASFIMDNFDGGEPEKRDFWYRCEYNLLFGLSLYVMNAYPEGKRNVASVYDILVKEGLPVIDNLAKPIMSKQPYYKPLRGFVMSAAAVKESAYNGLTIRLSQLNLTATQETSSNNEDADADKNEKPGESSEGEV